ncbi:MAG: hypothetical protein INR66_26425, partial [Gordonia polyisoprenivorans]|nr:hypothetical protein [Gordonia polyisoprenivorans]
MSEYEWLDEPSDQHDSADEELLDLGGSSRRRRWWVVVGVIVVAAVTGGILAGTLGSDSSPAAGPVRPPAPRTIEVHRTTYWEHPSTGLAVRAD